MKQKLFRLIPLFMFLVFVGVVLVFSYSFTSSLGSANRVGPDYLYPPIGFGELNPNVTQKNVDTTICKSGWTATIRPPVSYTNALKNKLLTSGKPSDFELDHYVSLELGGSPTSTNNLWMEAYETPIGIGARQKDTIESELKRRVCLGSLSLKDAQNIIMTDWYAEFLKKNGKLGSNVVESDTDD